MPLEQETDDVSVFGFLLESPEGGIGSAISSSSLDVQYLKTGLRFLSKYALSPVS